MRMSDQPRYQSTTPKRDKSAGTVVRGLTPTQWIEIRYQGKTYLVALKSLLDSYIKEKD